MPEWLFDFLSGPTIKIAEAIWNSSMRLIIKLVCSTPQKFSTGTWGICKRKPVSVGRGDRTLCSKFIFYDSLFESCEQPASKHHTGDGHRSNGQGCRGKCPVSQYLKYNDNHIFYLISDGERSLYDRCPRFKSRGYGYWLSIVLSAIWLALYTGSDRLQLFDVMDSI